MKESVSSLKEKNIGFPTFKLPQVLKPFYMTDLFDDFSI